MSEAILRVFDLRYARAQAKREPLLNHAVFSWVEDDRPRSIAVTLDTADEEGWTFEVPAGVVDAWREARAAAVCFFWESLKEQICLEGQAAVEPGERARLRLEPRRVEFWSNRASRLHERTVYALENGAWAKTKLYP